MFSRTYLSLLQCLDEFDGDGMAGRNIRGRKLAWSPSTRSWVMGYEAIRTGYGGGGKTGEVFVGSCAAGARRVTSNMERKPRCVALVVLWMTPGI
jgi:hypothetical protein